MRFAILGGLLVALVAPWFITSDSVLAIAIYGFMSAALAVSFNLIFGFTGQLSMFHAASFGVSAYVVTILVTSYGWNFWLAIPCALLLVVVLALFVGTICFRFKLKEFYFAVVTMAFSEVLRLITLNWNSVTNGSLGITVVDKPSLWTPWGSLTFSSGISWYYVTLVLLVVVYIVCQRVLASWIGQCLAAIRLNDLLGETLGIDVFKYKLISFAIGSALAGLVGAFYGFYAGFVEPHYLSIPLGLDIVAMVLLGGVNSLIGPVIGALMLTALPHVIELSAEFRIALYGAILIFVILVMPKGIMGLITSRKNAA
ncbi:branched-chain amino acid transport system permease protein [Rhodopseudomonas rhenobacensis]|uniref:Branched-chain amino acid transport system permease protein n=1 Tax=Rhodopseudomonas rhenobacensis TaxID=87461 RepID=A0A7W7Z6Z7_9BRAD|nr:branched-chain amino acid ABC transporter permease [Rhodopseudomonas rhenobacensis]MBB5049171.1 branched-chain amino acid transport system permease protein [Rhodopseudomonas rhenobacensis]